MHTSVKDLMDMSITRFTQIFHAMCTVLEKRNEQTGR